MELGYREPPSVHVAQRIAILRTQKPEIDSFEKVQQPFSYSFEKK